MLRKPNPIILELALIKAHLCASEVWHCEDDPAVDIEGAARAGMLPALYDSTASKGRGSCHDEKLCDVEYLHIHTWEEMTDALNKAPRG